MSSRTLALITCIPLLLSTGCPGSRHQKPSVDQPGFLSGNGWKGWLLTTDGSRNLRVTAIIEHQEAQARISVKDDAAMTLSLVGILDEEQQLVLSETGRPQKWTSRFGPITPNHLKVAVPLSAEQRGQPAPVLLVLDLSR